MLPVGLLMIEHRLIERVIKLWGKELQNIIKCQSINPALFDSSIDFMITYADKCHHGKEEGILFRDLKNKPVAAQLKKILDELISEHAVARKAMKALIQAKNRCAYPVDPSALNDFTQAIKTITDLYPRHIEKEDKHFFLPCMEYFNAQEKDKMLEEFREFDQELIHEKYKASVAHLEASFTK